jgi:hypothetical protein
MNIFNLVSHYYDQIGGNLVADFSGLPLLIINFNVILKLVANFCIGQGGRGQNKLHQIFPGIKLLLTTSKLFFFFFSPSLFK